MSLLNQGLAYKALVTSCVCKSSDFLFVYFNQSSSRKLTLKWCCHHCRSKRMKCCRGSRMTCFHKMAYFTIFLLNFLLRLAVLMKILIISIELLQSFKNNGQCYVFSLVFSVTIRSCCTKNWGIDYNSELFCISLRAVALSKVVDRLRAVFSSSNWCVRCQCIYEGISYCLVTTFLSTNCYVISIST